MGNQNVVGHQVIEQDGAVATRIVTGSSAATAVPNDTEINLEQDQQDSSNQFGGKELQLESIFPDDSDCPKYPCEPHLSAEFVELQEEQLGSDNSEQIADNAKVIHQLTPAEIENKKKIPAPDALSKIEQTVEISGADVKCGDEKLTCDEASYKDITKCILKNEGIKEPTTEDENSIKADTGKNNVIVPNCDEILEDIERWTDEHNLPEGRPQIAINEPEEGNQEKGQQQFSKELSIELSFMQLHQEGNVPTEPVNIYLNPVDPESGNSLDPSTAVDKSPRKELDDRDMSQTMLSRVRNEEKLEGGNINEVGYHNFHNQEELTDHSRQGQKTIKRQSMDLSFQETVQPITITPDEMHHDHYLILTPDTSLEKKKEMADNTSLVAITDTEFTDNKYGKGTEQEAHSNGQEFGQDRKFKGDRSLEFTPSLLDQTMIILNEDSGSVTNLPEDDNGYICYGTSDNANKLIFDHIKEFPEGTRSEEEEDTYEIDLVGGTLLPSHHVSEVFFPLLEQKPNAQVLEMAQDLGLSSSADPSPNITDETCVEEFRINQDWMNPSVSQEFDPVGNLTTPEVSQEPIFKQKEEEIKELTIENTQEDYASEDLAAEAVHSALSCQREDGEETTSVPVVDMECFACSSVYNIASPSGGTGEPETKPPSNTKSPKVDSFSSATCVADSVLHVKECPNDPDEEAIIVNTAKTATLKYQFATEKDDKEMLLRQQEEKDSGQVSSESNDSGKDSKPHSGLMNQEVPFAESWEKERSVCTTNSVNVVREPSVRKQTAPPRRERAKKTPKSFFGSCMCCTTTAIS